MHKRFMKLFKGNIRSYGQFHPKNSRMETIKDEATITQFISHFEGKTGIGSVAIDDKNKCLWGAIDIDNHSGTDINITKIVKDVHDQGLPLIVCESKSGGAHCYLFAKEAIPARYIRNILSRWASDIGHGDSEVFPKQSKLLKDKETGDRQLGNWINLPYFRENTRLAKIIEKGKYKDLNLAEFVEMAELNQIDQKTIEEFLVVDHPEAPPCIQSMIKEGVDGGHRNEAMYNLAIYMKKAFPDHYKDRLYDLNQSIFARPLSFVEAKKTVVSATKKDYKYKCMEEPCKSHCDSDICLDREFGIDSGDVDSLSRADMPDITELKIYDMDPPIWEMKINKVKVSMTTAQLYQYASFAQIVMEKLLIVIPPMKNGDWMNKLSGLMSQTERIKTPEDASIPGMIKQKLIEFLRKADLTEDGKDKSIREAIKRGMPVVQILGVEGLGGRHLVFRGGDFVSYLKRTKSEELKGSALWNVMKHYGVEHSRIRILGGVTQVWNLPLDKHDRTPLDLDYNKKAPEKMEKSKNVAKFKTEF